MWQNYVVCERQTNKISKLGWINCNLYKLVLNIGTFISLIRKAEEEHYLLWHVAFN